MVVLGGAGTRYGALLGGFLHARRPAPGLARRVGADREAALGAVDAAVRAAVHPRHDLHPARLLRPGWSREPGSPNAPDAPQPRPGGGRVKIAWERHGSGPTLLRSWARTRWGWEPVVEPLARFDVSSRQPRHRRDDAARACTRRWSWRRRSRCSTRRVARAHVVGSSLGGMIAQELRWRVPSASSGSCSRARRPAGRRRS